MSDNATKWWLSVAPQEAELAKLIASHHGMDPERTGLPFEPPTFAVPNGYFTPVRLGDLVPLWTCYVNEARLALNLVKDGKPLTEVVQVETVLNAQLSPSDDWRKEIGLDGSQADQA